MRILRLAFGNWFSRAYLAGVAVVAALVTVSLVTWDQPDANLAAVWLIFVTLPFSFLGVLAPDSAAGPALLGGVALGAFVNAVLIGGLVSLVRRRPAH
ncbi:SCO4225 family membrane protein [Cryptosporangium aurantiacum]|uniref:Uncharacterized protein n=1 Tax=Cryptosporangium aurantiacum TaxID=134849 RepID=A0A1M7R7D5_9ACTN|nr:hypothetical protein [Cryptosporangium aurantiacum]SHN42204.1 hypothetical protein SAMN05443668_108122 [Cryptosporangium aurantiacum]